MNFKKYQKIKAMQTFKQKFSEMTKEYRNGFRDDFIRTYSPSNKTMKELSTRQAG